MFYPAALWAATLSFCIFSKLRLSNPKHKNIIKFSSAAEKFEENLRNKGFFNTKNQNAKRNDEEKTAKIHFFSCSKNCKLLIFNLCYLELQFKILKKLSFLS